MKHLKYIIVPALSGLLFAACSTEPKGPSAAELDTQVEAKVKAATDQLKADCDSRMMSAAQLKADSIMAKAAKKPAPRPAPAPVAAAPKPAPTPKAAPTPKPKATPKAPVKTNPKNDRFENGGGKKATAEDTKAKNDRFENDGKKEVTPADTKKKEDRFK